MRHAPHSVPRFTRPILPLMFASALLLMALYSTSTQALGPWYVTTTGNDSNDCLSSISACASINGVLNKLQFLPGDTILVASGTYTGTESEVVLLTKNATVVGGWDDSFATQAGTSFVDGEQTRRGTVVMAGVTASMSHFTIQNGVERFRSGTYGGGGISNAGNLSLADSQVISNASSFGTGTAIGGGVASSGALTLSNSIVRDNFSDTAGAGLSVGGRTFITHSSITNNVIRPGGSGGGGGAGIFGTGQIVINRSALTNNTVNGMYYGSAIALQGNSTLALNNSTLSHNRTINTGGNSGTATIYLFGGQATLSSDTIYSEDDNTLYTYGGTIRLQNSIIVHGNDSDCNIAANGVVQSLGYNLLQKNPYCPSGTGDLTGVDPKVFPVAMGTPGVHVLMPGSPAIDAGNPAGCMDDKGVPLTTDERGAPRIGRCDIGSYEFDPNNIPSVNQTFLPSLARDYCPPFIDDFSSGRGWSLLDNSIARLAYIAGEYQAWLKQGGYRFLVRAPTCPRENYVVEVDGHWAGTPGYRYGLIFGAAADLSSYFLFDVDTQQQLYRLWYCYPNSSCSGLATDTYDPVIQTGTAVNHFKATRNGLDLSIELNGTFLGKWTEVWGSGHAYVGVTVSSAPGQMADARFDNFSVSNLSSSGQRAQAASTLATPGLPADVRWRVIQFPANVPQLWTDRTQ